MSDVMVTMAINNHNSVQLCLASHTLPTQEVIKQKKFFFLLEDI